MDLLVRITNLLDVRNVYYRVRLQANVAIFSDVLAIKVKYLPILPNPNFIFDNTLNFRNGYFWLELNFD